MLCFAWVLGDLEAAAEEKCLMKMKFEFALNGMSFDCVSECCNYICHAVIKHLQCGHSVSLFCLQMVWENGCVVIVMLTSLAENGVKQCYHYWPDEGSNLYHIYEVYLSLFYVDNRFCLTMPFFQDRWISLPKINI